jgi:hypothetical protein
MPNNERRTSNAAEPTPRANDPSLADWTRIIRAEYLELPGLCLTKPQAQRLWGLDPLVCDALIGALVDVRFLRRTHDDSYVRADAG